MSRKNTEFEIDGTRYASTQYSGTKGTELFVKVIKSIGEPLSYIMKGAQGGIDSEFNLEMFGSALRSFASTAEPKEFTAMMKEILDGTLIFVDNQNRTIQYDVDFSGRIGHMFKVVFHILKFQFSDFLDVVGGLTPANPTTAKFKAL